LFIEVATTKRHKRKFWMMQVRKKKALHRKLPLKGILRRRGLSLSNK
jgi:hypothetical protein